MRMKYACGHELEGTIELAGIMWRDLTPFMHWVKTHGYDGDKSLCWNCWVTKTQDDVTDTK